MKSVNRSTHLLLSPVRMKWVTGVRCFHSLPGNTLINLARAVGLLH
ncbi:unnamed protein product [Acanthoscelides obtectus]|uniref:Uncharacterized protein n=1 Tax=Acanthoscelides obtectus TaxID=200917 RepID=A0A9P0L118_ACAOB|nr:unnamed protein product [Acanthoscelides obtectus]CAK1650893.1 hypothetical protein AOBTE_LOCUS16952 [Acanthoscelides obtectus]